jgi:hypothetical protein
VTRSASIEVQRWTSTGVRVEITGDLDLPDAAALDREWDRQRAANPRLHDGPVLHVDDADPARGVVSCRRSSYRAFVAGHAVGVRVRSLGVTGVCLDGSLVLLGRRAANVRIYAGLWETAPRGGVAPPANAATLTFDDLAACLRAEGREELGLDVTPSRVVAAVVDPEASSLDLVIECAVGPGAADPNWEYSARRWLPLGVAREWARDTPPPDLVGESLSPPAAAWLAS